MHSSPLLLVVAEGPRVGEMLRASGHRVELMSSAAQALAVLARGEHDIVVAIDDADAIDTWAAQCGRELEVVTVARSEMEQLLPRVERAVERRRARLEKRELSAYLAQANAKIEAMNQAVESLLRDRARQLEYLAQANAQIEEMNQRMERLIGDRSRQVEYLSQANTQVEQLNQALATSVSQHSKQIDYLSQANAQIEEMNLRLDSYVAERTRALTEANEKLKEMTLTDELTGLYNQRWLRARLDEEFQRALRHNQTLAVLMIDIDLFKNVNDSHDHLFGSDVLKRVGEILRQGVRGIDVAVRYGGDEFCVILPQTSLAGAVAVAERLRVAAARADVGEPGRSYKVTLSIGVAALGECEAETGLGLLQAADRALYAAKENGRNRVAAMNGKHAVTSVG